MEYLLFLFLDISVFAAIFLTFISTYHPKKFVEFVDVAKFGIQREAWVSKHKYPWYQTDRLWRNFYLGLSILGYSFISYGIVKFLFGWLPFVPHCENFGYATISILTVVLFAMILQFVSDVHKASLSKQIDEEKYDN